MVEGVIIDFMTRCRADVELTEELDAEALEDLRQLTTEFLRKELRGESTLTPWTNIRAEMFELGLADDEYRAVLSHFIVALFASSIPPSIAARLAARIEWSAGADDRRALRGQVGS